MQNKILGKTVPKIKSIKENTEKQDILKNAEQTIYEKDNQLKVIIKYSFLSM